MIRADTGDPHRASPAMVIFRPPAVVFIFLPESEGRDLQVAHRGHAIQHHSPGLSVFQIGPAVFTQRVTRRQPFPVLQCKAGVASGQTIETVKVINTGHAIALLGGSRVVFVTVHMVADQLQIEACPRDLFQPQVEGIVIRVALISLIHRVGFGFIGG